MEKKKEKEEETAKLLLLREEMKELSFKPAINNASREIGNSVLQVSSQPDTFIARVMEKKKEKEVRAEQELQAREQAEVAACTFHPAIHASAPAYVTAHVKSMTPSKSKKERKKVER